MFSSLSTAQNKIIFSSSIFTELGTTPGATDTAVNTARNAPYPHGVDSQHQGSTNDHLGATCGLPSVCVNKVLLENTTPIYNCLWLLWHYNVELTLWPTTSETLTL